MCRMTIKDDDVHRMAKALAEEHNTNMTEEVRQAVRERYDQMESRNNQRADVTKLTREISKDTGKLFIGEASIRNLEDDLYDENGLPK